MKFKLFLVALFFFKSLALAEKLNVESASKNRKWHILLHYRPTIFGFSKSEIAESNFFLDPKGRSSPQAELEATIAGFEKDPELACRYPARRRFLTEELGLKINSIKCERYERWLTLFNPKSVSLVFASSFFGNAASAFGHTLLKINSTLNAPDGPQNSLLDYGLNFAAQTPPNEKGLIFAYKGLAGGYRGAFSILPYVEKVQEYRDREERNLWEYQLNLSSSQVLRLLEHLWELESSKIPYYFLNKNCSYQLLSLLEVANPDWQLTNAFTYWALPTDTIRVLAQIPNAITDVKYRPSLHQLLKGRIREMSDTEKQSFLQIRSDSSKPIDTSSILVIDSLLAEQKFRYGSDSKLYPTKEAERLKSLLQARARASGPSPQVQPEIILKERIDQATGSRRVSIAGGQSGGRHFREIELRPAYRDALDADSGSLSFSEISVLQLRLRELPDDKEGIRLELLKLLRIVSMNPADELQTRLSWMLDVGILTAPDEMATQAEIGKTRQIQAGAGYSTYLLRDSENLLFYTFLKLNAEHSDNREDKFRYGPSASIGLTARLAKYLKAAANTEFFSFRYFNDDGDRSYFRFSELQLSWTFLKDWNLRVEKRLINKPSENEHRISLARYF